MSTTAAALTVLAFLLAALPAAHWLILRWRRATADCERIASEGHDVGPDPLLLLQTLDAHLDAYFAQVAPLFEEPAPRLVDPVLGAGCDRLRQALRDHREEDGT